MGSVITDHARFEAQRRNIDLHFVESIIESPQQKVSSRRNRIVFQSKVYDKILGKEMLMRVIVEQSGDILKVISIYKTSKIGRYWVKGGR